MGRSQQYPSLTALAADAIAGSRDQNRLAELLTAH